MEKVPRVRMSDSKAVLGCPVTSSSGTSVVVMLSSRTDTLMEAAMFSVVTVSVRFDTMIIIGS